MAQWEAGLTDIVKVPPSLSDQTRARSGRPVDTLRYNAACQRSCSGH